MINKKIFAFLLFSLHACGSCEENPSESGQEEYVPQDLERQYDLVVKGKQPNGQAIEGDDLKSNDGMPPVSNKGNRGGKTPEIPRKTDLNYPTGIENIGNSCYFNSVIQTLYNIEIFRKGIIDFKPTDEEMDLAKQSQQKLQEDLRKLKQKRYQLKKDIELGNIALQQELDATQKQLITINRALNLQNLQATQGLFKGMSSDRDRFRPKQLPGHKWKQEDASELCSSILDMLKECDVGNIHDNFYFKEKVKTVREKCPNCLASRMEDEIMEEMSILPLSLQGNNLEDCLGAHFKQETLLGANRLQCCNDLCNPKTLVDSSTQTLLSSVPQYLIIQFLRFSDTLVATQVNKDNRRVEFPTNLAIKPEWCDDSLKKQSLPNYDLTEVIVHSGSTSGGHYWSYVKKLKKDGAVAWYECNDSNVSEVAMNGALLERLYGDDSRSDSAYILIYSKVE